MFKRRRRGRADTQVIGRHLANAEPNHDRPNLDCPDQQPAGHQRYHHVFETEVLEHLGAIAGFRGAYLLARPDRGAMAIRTLTLLESLEAVRRFADS
jgi:hypothetical protein